ncbi:MAG: HDOD domain-containing protein [Terracidiphilus sp.]
MSLIRYPAESQAEDREFPGELRHLARQPILDARGQVHAYELLFRAAAENAGDDDAATRTILDNSMVFGLEKIARGLPAFVNCTLQVLTQEQVRVLPPRMTVLEIRETVKPTPELIQACIRLKSSGYRIALDDFTWSSPLQPLVLFADFIKVDFLKVSEDERRLLLSKLPYNSTLIAEKVETRADFETARTEGFSLFQGFYFCAPAAVHVAKIPANRLCHLQMLQLLQHDPIDLHKIAEQVKLDPGLSYRLLRLVNSPACAIRQNVCSIEMALMAIGDDQFRRLASLAIASQLSGGESNEILRMAFIRARFCELAAPLFGFEPGEQYLIGLFSMLPAMLKVPMKDLLLALPLRWEMQEALLDHDEPVRAPLQWVEAEERREWELCRQIASNRGLPPSELADRYLTAILWADEALPAAEAPPRN